MQTSAFRIQIPGQSLLRSRSRLKHVFPRRPESRSSLTTAVHQNVFCAFERRVHMDMGAMALRSIALRKCRRWPEVAVLHQLLQLAVAFFIARCDEFALRPSRQTDTRRTTSCLPWDFSAREEVPCDPVHIQCASYRSNPSVQLEIPRTMSPLRMWILSASLLLWTLGAWGLSVDATAHKDASVLILGGGVAGVIAARTLHAKGITNFTIVEAKGGYLHMTLWNWVTLRRGFRHTFSCAKCRRK
ncbi:hypothetical protein NUW54_g5077 [Trametes sanguinea]|uniref:Uncharacterized protein n=1 Tax=Trametes sanguinea TaxID=158606 RepID=A0ACC1PW93_9APHY|nr:hypothetical protein NUW54_g5077 [Trametes sanguinea]